MAHEILTVKLRELEEQFSQLSSRIRQSEAASRPQLQHELRALRRECAETERILHAKLRDSRTGMASILADSYGEVEQSVEKARTALQEQACRCGDPEAAAEEKIFLAEYALDFALQGANRALLLALEAIDAQMSGREGDRKSS